MAFYSLDLDALSEYTETPVEQLKTNSYAKLEQMVKDMQVDKIMKQNAYNAKDAEFKRLVLKYFEPMRLLSPWFTDEEIVLACANEGLTDSSLCAETHVPLGQDLTKWNKKAEFLRESIESVPEYTKDGRQLAEPKRERRRVYRIGSPHQGLHHAQVILHLLYDRYPELKFDFSAYGMTYDEIETYEIYYKNHVYVPFVALMTGNVDAILYRNRSYWKQYNGKVDECEERLRSKMTRRLLSFIQTIGENERNLGHQYKPIFSEKATMKKASNGLTMQYEPLSCYKRMTSVHIDGTQGLTGNELTERLMAWSDEMGIPVDIQILEWRDFFGEKPLENAGALAAQSVFAWIEPGNLHVTIRVKDDK